MPISSPGRIALTGASGFAGSAIARALAARGHRLRLLVRRLPRAALLPDCDMEIEIGDLADRPALRRFLDGVDSIVHVAGAVKARQPSGFRIANVEGTRHLLLAAREAAPMARLIHISSLAAREGDLSPYARSKRDSEESVRNFAGDRPWTILRPPVIYGPGDRELLPLFRMASRGIFFYPAARRARLAFLHVDDLASAILALLETEEPANRILEIDDGSGGHDWTEIAGAFAAAVGHDLRPRRLSYPLVLPFAAATSLFAYLANRPQVFALWKMPEIYHPDWGSRSDRVPGWQPKYPLAEGIAATYNAYRTHGLIT